MQNEIQKWYAHIDLDAFFASVEQLDHPEYKGKPVIVGGKPEDRRGVVSTASYEARKFGVHSAMPTFQAYKLCPQGIFVHGNYRRYSELSYQIMTIFRDYSPEVDQMSIDEAFIDLTGTEKLFGPPEDTCKRIKERIKKETGLTVSIGLASTKYVAKICSGYKKPDGFYMVTPGKETDFMLLLPLEKVWGVGEKTLLNLHQKGIFTTKDIYEKDLETLTFLFGANTGGFLYDVVRGGKNALFKKETKSHSISSEKTFPFDLIDDYTLETEIMELAQDVMFRLLKEKGYSRTAFLKIRYEDFTTVSIQRTLDQNIKTLDTFYEILTTLFKEKREKNRGVRLLGVGFENIENVERPEQQSLFEDNIKKKQIVEKAILQLNQKHPEIKVQKARTLKLTVISLLFFLNLFGFCHENLWAQNKTSNKGAGTILSDNLTSTESENTEPILFETDKSKYEFDVSGYWNIDFSTSLISTFGNNTPFGFSFIPPLFKQEIELSSWILLNNKWYFDASFADGFVKNTFTAGYKNGNYLNSAIISNRNIGVSNNYSASYFGYGLKGGKNQAPGIAVQFIDIKNNKWKGDLMVRYDMTHSKEVTFYGMNNVSDTLISLIDFATGKVFIFPEAVSGSLENIKDIYVENKKGEYRDSNDKRYLKLSKSNYSIFELISQINFTSDAKTGAQENQLPSILVTFEQDSIVDEIILATGSYNSKESFSGQIQQFFNSNYDIDLNKYSYNLKNNINGQSALVIQNSTGFSPYACSNIYDCGNIQNADLAVISQTTETLCPFLTAVQIQNTENIIEDFINDKHLYAQLLSSNIQNSSLQLPENRYPLGAVKPQIYLKLTDKEDNVIRVRSYSPVKSLQIGTNAIEGTVYVYKNGIIDTGSVYNPNTGEVSLSTAINDTDKIVIMYQEDSEDFSGGSLAAGLGFIYSFTPDFVFNSLVSTRLPISINEKYSTVDSRLNSFTALTSGISFKKNNFSLEDKIALSIQNPDQTETLLVHSNERYVNSTFYLSSASGFTTKTIPYINDYNLEAENNVSLNTAGIQDSYISGYAIPLSWDFSKADNSDNLWASIDIKLDRGNLLANSSCMEIALKPQFSEAIDTDNYDLYLQLGVKASSDYYGEDREAVKTWNISKENVRTPAPVDLSKKEWQIVKINLEDSERAFLTSSNDARFIIIRKQEDALSPKGRILIGPYEPYVQSAFTTASEDISVQTFTELTESSPSSKQLGINKNYSNLIKWNTQTEFNDFLKTEISTSIYFKAADFSNYKNINLDFAFEAETFAPAALDNKPVLTLILDRESISSDLEGNTALKLELYNLSNYIHSSLKYHTLTININSKKVYIDNEPLSAQDFKVLQLNRNIAPARQKIILNINQSGNYYKKGTFYINNLYYSDTETYAQLQNNLITEYKKEGTIASIKDFIILKDFKLLINSTQNASTLNAVNMETTAEGEITAFNLQLQTDITQKYSNTDPSLFISQAGHSIQTSSPVFNFVSLNETYRYNSDSEALSKVDSMNMTFEKIGLKLSGRTEASESQNLRSQNVNLDQNFKYNFKKSTFNLDSKLLANQKIDTKLTGYEAFNTNDYFKGWYDISKLQFSAGDESASSRNIDYKLSSELSFQEKIYSPVCEYNLSSFYLSATENKYLLNQSLVLKNPFKINKQNFSFNYTKKSSNSVLAVNKGNYFEDANLLFKNIRTNSYFWQTVPFIELFSKNLEQKLVNINSSNLYSSYTSKYEFEWKRPIFNSFKDLYIPLKTKLIIERDTKLSDILSDIYQLKFTTGNTAVNNFGSKAQKPVFNWFESDELQTNLSVIVKLPSDNLSSTVYSIAWYGQFLIFINEKTTINNALDFQIDTEKSWNSKATAIYTRPAKKSFLVDMTEYFVPELKNKQFQISQKETVNLQAGKNTIQYYSVIDYLHTSSISFMKNYSLDFGIGTTFTWNQFTASTMAINLNLSGKMKF